MLKRASRRNLIGYVLGVLAFAHAANAEDVTCANFRQMEPEQLVAQVKWNGAQEYPPTPGCSRNDQETCEWSNAVILDRIIGERRLVVVNSNHETGSGAWDYVTIYGCEGDKVNAVFDKQYLYGAGISKLSPTKIVLESGEWLKNDPACCASHEKIETYIWDTRTQSYKRSGRILRVARDTPRE